MIPQEFPLSVAELRARLLAYPNQDAPEFCSQATFCCPLACVLQPMLKLRYYELRVDVSHVHIVPRDKPRYEIRLPLWAKAFVRTIDSLGSASVTPRMALEALDAVDC